MDFTRNPGKNVKEFLTTDFADFIDEHDATHPCDPRNPRSNTAIENQAAFFNSISPWQCDFTVLRSLWSILTCCCRPRRCPSFGLQVTPAARQSGVVVVYGNLISLPIQRVWVDFQPETHGVYNGDSFAFFDFFCG